MTSAILSKLANWYPEVLTNPESILGPNHPKVLEFWIYIDGLSEDKQNEMEKLYLALDSKVLNSALIAASNAAEEVVGEEFSDAAWDAAIIVTGWGVFGDATYELIGNVDNKVAYDLIMSHKKSSWFRRLTKFLTSWYS
jgi:hypothetical protein